MPAPLNNLTADNSNAVAKFFRKLFSGEGYATAREKAVIRREQADLAARKAAAEAHKKWLADLSAQRDAENERKMILVSLRNEDQACRTEAGSLGRDLVTMAGEIAEQTTSLEVAKLTETDTPELRASVEKRTAELRGYIINTKRRLAEVRERQEKVQAKIAAAQQ